MFSVSDLPPLSKKWGSNSRHKKVRYTISRFMLGYLEVSQHCKLFYLFCFSLRDTDCWTRNTYISYLAVNLRT
jgi:hypothetical protein